MSTISQRVNRWQTGDEFIASQDCRKEEGRGEESTSC